MLYYDRTDVFERIDINKTSASRECDICHYWHFLNKDFKFQSYVIDTMIYQWCLWTYLYVKH